ncbi:ABC-2 type transport system ATP-binding protein [Murinocardiopsis flavida]|uniref:ABC-2 type transport system ATP-binding protein n=1 Tax=Murinocardiopsis flavida TaxID=645275 RepID=A0A2P8DEH0_9ACTN|nr:ABC transporter ATP-binding protein [Murinocardiopsis flavida]PSK95620.1 ABC-2 type transport system ATP-binding protein [Murinocardiopsis flavida]
MSASTRPVITTANLTKRYGRHQALFGLDMEVDEGEVFGFLGPNGSGKTTTIRILLDLIRRSGGESRVFGLDTRADGMAIRRRVGYLPGELAMVSRRPARELLTHLANLRGGVPQHRISALAERLDLDLSRPVRGLSKGNKQKVGLIQAFMHDPDLLILDEPTSGLDPLLQQEFLAMVRRARADGRTVFMSSHVLSEVQDVADRAAVIRGGRIVAVEDIDALRDRMVREFRVRVAGRVRAEDFTAIDNLRELHIEGDSVRCTVDGSPDALVKAAARYTVLSLDSTEPDLEELFFHHYNRNGADGTVGIEGADRHAAA